MLTVLVGFDTIARAKRLDAVLAPFRKSGADIQQFSDVTFSTDAIRGIAGNASLFGGATVCVLSGVCDTAEMRDSVERLIPEMAASPHQFILVENSLLAPFLKKVESKKGTVEKFEL